MKPSVLKLRRDILDLKTCTAKFHCSKWFTDLDFSEKKLSWLHVWHKSKSDHSIQRSLKSETKTKTTKIDLPSEAALLNFLLSLFCFIQSTWHRSFLLTTVKVMRQVLSLDSSHWAVSCFMAIKTQIRFRRQTFDILISFDPSATRRLLQIHRKCYRAGFLNIRINLSTC